jgi:sporulation protein YlmC with PRC-barrel domain
VETNESILTREVVSLGDRKILGKLEGLRVDCDTCAISHFIVRNPSTGTSMVLPFNRSVAIGDTFLTIQSREDILPASQEADRIVDEGFKATGIEVFSKAGNRLGVVQGYEFDPTYGEVTKLDMGDDADFNADDFIFFSPDFIFVDDGEPTASEMRATPKTAAVKHEPVSTAKPAWFDNASQQVEEAHVEPVVELVADEPAMSDEDQALREFLIGALVDDDVVSEDGLFKVAKGERLTAEQVTEAEKHEALLLLTMSVAT